MIGPKLLRKICKISLITTCSKVRYARYRVDERICDQVEFLGQFPYLGRKSAARNTRELVIYTTPYFVLYRVDEDRITVLRVLHTARERHTGL